MARPVRGERVWVDPEFARLLKVKAVSRGMKYLDYTREVARNPNTFVSENSIESRVTNKKRGARFDTLF